MFEKLKYWWTVKRHIKALAKQEMIAVTGIDLARHYAVIAEFARWARESGSLNDGTTRNHTKKRVMWFAAMLDAGVPVVQTGEYDGA